MPGLSQEIVFGDESDDDDDDSGDDGGDDNNESDYNGASSRPPPLSNTANLSVTDEFASFNEALDDETLVAAAIEIENATQTKTL